MSNPVTRNNQPINLFSTYPCPGRLSSLLLVLRINLHTCCSCCLRAVCVQSLAGERSRFKAIDSAPFLQYVSGPSSNCLASIIGVGTPLILRNTQFFSSPFFLLLHYKSPRRTIFSLTVETHFVACLPSVTGTRVRFEVTFFLNYMFLEDVKFKLSLSLRIYFLSSFFHV